MNGPAREPIRTVEIGSVPETDPAAAVEEAFRLHPHWPSVPELTARGPLEGAIARALEGFPFVADPAAGRLSIDRDDPALVRAVSDADPEVPFARTAALAPFLARAHRRPSLRYKVALLGPVALARNVTDVRGRPLSEVPTVADAVGAYVAKLAFQLASHLSQAPEAPGGAGLAGYLQLDEPGTTDSLTPAEEARIRDAAGAVEAGLCRTVLHDCGARTGVGLARLAGDVDVVSFDATRPVVPLLGDAGLDLRRRRDEIRVIWGVVPTDGRALPPPTFGRDLLRRAALVLGDGPWRSDVWFSPACGLGTLDVARAAHVRYALRTIAAAATA